MTRKPTVERFGRTPLFLDELTLEVTVDQEPGRGGRPDLWPSVGEYPCYDPFLYHAMARDLVRNREFERALRRVVPHRRVLDIGAGQDLLWTLTAARLGAREVVAVEALPGAYEKARRLLTGRPEATAVELVPGSSTEVTIGGRAEVCVAEVIGSIASAEGMLAVVADARRRHLTEDAVVVPHRCTTEVGAVCLREELPGGLALSVDALPYLEQIFERHGGPFDIRLAVSNLPATAVLSTAGTVEDLPFNGPPRWADTAEVTLRMTRDGAVDGLLCWITIAAAAGGAVVDTLHERTSWVPVYLPLFDEPVAVRAADRLDVHFGRRAGADGVHPDYEVSARLHTAAGTATASFLSWHHGGGLGSAAVYRELFQPWMATT